MMERIHADGRVSESMKARLRQEFSHLEGIGSHPHLVHYTGFKLDHSVVQVTMQSTTAQSLESLLDQFGTLHRSLIARFVEQLFQALSHLAEVRYDRIFMTAAVFARTRRFVLVVHPSRF